MARGNRLGFENVENADVTDELALIEDPSDTVEAHLVEIATDGQGEVVDQVDLDQLGDDMSDLVAHARNVEGSMEEGGLDPIAARSTEIAVESIAQRWGCKRKKMGLENFQGSGRKDATQLGLEGIIDTAKDLGGRIWAWIISKIEQAQVAWNKFSNVGKSSKKRIEKMRAQVKNLRGAADDGETIPGKKIYKIATSKDAIAKIDKMTGSDISSAANQIASLSSAALNAASTALETTGNVTAKIDAAEVQISDLTSGKLVWAANGSERKFASLIPPSAKDISLGFTYGGVVITYTDSDGNPCLTYKDVTAEQIMEFEAPVLSTERMNDLLNIAFDTAAGLDQYFQTMNKVNSAMKKLKDAIKRKQSTYDKEFAKGKTDSAGLETKRNEVNAAKAAFETGMELETMYRRVSVNLIQGITAYVSESMKLYKIED